MEDHAALMQKILKDISQGDDGVRNQFLGEFHQASNDFAQHMATAVLRWLSMIETNVPDPLGDSKLAPLKPMFVKDIRKGYVSMFVFLAITLHIQSMKLFLSGHVVAAGNLMRQVLESMAMALLCSSSPLGVLEKFIRGRFFTQRSIPQVIKNANRLGLNEGIKGIQKIQNLYHKYSHLSQSTLLNYLSFETKGLNTGCSFDGGKVRWYKAEVTVRLGLAKVFSNFIELVSRNMST
jgi:hypothetical protein